MRELAPEIVTRLMQAEHPPAQQRDPADVFGVTLALAALALAVALALADIAGDATGATGLPPLTPLAEGHDWNGFSA